MTEASLSSEPPLVLASWMQSPARTVATSAVASVDPPVAEAASAIGSTTASSTATTGSSSIQIAARLVSGRPGSSCGPWLPGCGAAAGAVAGRRTGCGAARSA